MLFSRLQRNEAYGVCCPFKQIRGSITGYWILYFAHSVPISFPSRFFPLVFGFIYNTAFFFLLLAPFAPLLAAFAAARAAEIKRQIRCLHGCLMEKRLRRTWTAKG